MRPKSQDETILAVVCPMCGYANEVLESEGLGRSCPECHTTMIADNLSGRKQRLIKRNLKIVKPSTNSRKETRTMTKAAKTRKPPVGPL